MNISRHLLFVTDAYNWRCHTFSDFHIPICLGAHDTGLTCIYAYIIPSDVHDAKKIHFNPNALAFQVENHVRSTVYSVEFVKRKTLLKT